MSKEKIKVYLYTRVSTSIQIDGYSLEAQKSRMKAFALYNDYEIVGEYEDAGKSGKSIEGRVQFTRMMEDIKTGKDGVSFVLVFKLSRFARNAADVLSTLQTMQDFGVNLICVEDGIDSSKDAGKLMISVLSAVAEIERENIRVQTMEGRIQKAREGKWNGGFAPYGYQLIDGKLIINEEEAIAIRTIFDQYVNTTIGANGLSKYLENHGIRKIPRQNGKNPLFDAGLIRKILKNPVYNGKIAFGRRTLEKVHGTRNEYKQVEQDEYLIAEGIHEAIISDELWQAAQVKLKSQAKKYEHVNKGKDTRTHLLSGIVKCPICGVGMFGNKCIKKKKDGTKYKDFYYYGCKHRHMIRGHKCTYNKQIREELLDDAVAEVIIKIVSNPKFASMMQEKINMKVDTSEIEKEIDNYQKELRKSHSTKFKLIEEIDNLDADDKHYKRRKQDLDDRLYRMYDKIEDLESLLIDAKAKKQTIEAEKLTGDNIYKILIYFDKLYKVMNDVERRQLITALISEIQIYEEKQPNGQWLKSITFKLPIIDEDLNIGLDNNEQVEWEVFISNKINDEEYCKGYSFKEITQGINYKTIDDLHLAVSLRSFRSENVSEFVKAVLDVEKDKAKNLYDKFKKDYSICITRDLRTAKNWVQEKAKGSQRYGITASSGAKRLRKYGVWVQNKIKAPNWFLNGKEDVRSSYFLEETATEFDIQGLELDWTIVCWDANLRFNNDSFDYYEFKGTKWQKVNNKDNILYLKNAYRVLLTRARQGIIIFIPTGNDDDKTMKLEYYDGIYNYLKEIGLEEI